MAKTLEQLLGFNAMLGIVELVKSGLPTDGLLNRMLGMTRGSEGNQGSYWRVEGTRQTSIRVAYGSPSVRRAQKGASEVPVNLLHTFEHIVHKPTTLTQLQSMDNPARQKLGQQEIDRQTGLFLQYFRNLRIAAVCSALAKGYIWFDINGNLLPSSSNAVDTIDFGIPAGNKDQLDVFGTAAIIGASWATDGTDILGDLTAIKKASIKKSGYPLRYALYGENIPEYLVSNTNIKNMIGGNPRMSDAFSKGEIPDGLGGFTWIPAYQWFYEDTDNTLQDWWGGDTVVFIPEPARDWFEVLEGTYPVPTRLGNVSRDGVAALGDIAEVGGAFSYATITDDPVGIKHLAGDTFLPVITSPYAVFIADVTP